MSADLPIETHRQIAEWEASLSAALANWNAATAEQFSGLVRRNIRTGIARETAGFIRRVHYRNFNYSGFRSLLRSWRYLEEIKLRDDLATRSDTNASIDFKFEISERLYIGQIKSDNTVSVSTNLSYSSNKEINCVVDGQHRYFYYMFDTVGDYLSVRDEWRIVYGVLDNLSVIEENLADSELIRALLELWEAEVQDRSYCRTFFSFKIIEEDFSTSLYEYVRRHFVITSLCPPATTVDFNCSKSTGLGLQPDDHNKGPADRGPPSRREPRGNARYPRPSGCGRRVTCRITRGGHPLRRITCDTRDHPTAPSILRRRRKCPMDYLRVACA